MAEMPRELWAKVAVEIVRDTKLLPREPWERWLWLGLICLTKENANGDGMLHGYNPRLLASVLDLRVSPAKVKAALGAFAAAGMVRLHADDAIELVHFKKRQEAGLNGTREQARERKERWKERHGNGDGTPQATEAERPGNVIEEEEEEEQAAEVVRIRSDAPPKSPPPPPISAPPPEKPKAPNGSEDPLESYLRATWPALENPNGLAASWRVKWRGVDLLAEAKAALAYELETQTKHDRPANFLRGWMRRAAENPGQSRPTSRGGFLQEGTAAWDAAKLAADERAKRRIAETKALFEKRDRIQREGHE